MIYNSQKNDEIGTPYKRIEMKNQGSIYCF